MGMGKKGQKSRRGKPEMYDEPKSKIVVLNMTPTGLLLLDQKIQAHDPKLSRSEYIERLARGTL